jgi:hypothetical protein
LERIPIIAQQDFDGLQRRFTLVLGGHGFQLLREWVDVDNQPLAMTTSHRSTPNGFAHNSERNLSLAFS